MEHGPAHFMSIVFALLARGYRLELRGVRYSSYYAKVFNALDQCVGDLAYRCPSEEPNPDAQGLSYGSHVTDPMYEPDDVFLFVVEKI